MDRCRAPAPAAVIKPDHGGDAGDDPDELGVFAAERYFYGDDDDALWRERSSSSLSSAFRTGTLEHDHDRSAPTPTAATSSSEASWNSRSALLPPNDPPPAEKLRAVVAAAAGTPVVEAVAKPSGSGAESERAGHRRASSSSLRRWLLGVAGCACCARGDGGESVSSDEMEPRNDVLGGARGKKWNSGGSELFVPRTEGLELASEEAMAVTVRPGTGSGRWLLEGDQVEIAGEGYRRAASSVELPRPIFRPAATATSDERRRVLKSLEQVRPLYDDQGSALGTATQTSAFTIVAGNAAPGDAPSRAAGAEDDEAAPTPSELGCAYPPSEASVVWSVVTADGAASGNFSSAASGYYRHYFSYGDDSTPRHAAAKSDRRRRSGIASTATSSSLLTCIGEKAVDAVGPAQAPVHRPEAEPAAVARLGAAAGRRNGHGGGCQDVVRRRVGR